MVVDAQVFHLTGVEPRAMLHTADSGRNLTRWVCPGCGSWICRAQSLGRRTPTHFAPCAAEPWTTPLGYVQPRIFGLGASSPGSCCPMSEATSKRSRTTCSHSSTRWQPMCAKRAPDGVLLPEGQENARLSGLTEHVWLRAAGWSSRDDAQCLPSRDWRWPDHSAPALRSKRRRGRTSQRLCARGSLDQRRRRFRFAKGAPREI